MNDDECVMISHFVVVQCIIPFISFTAVCLSDLVYWINTKKDNAIYLKNITSVSFMSDSYVVFLMSILSLSTQFIEQKFKLFKVIFDSQEFFCVTPGCYLCHVLRVGNPRG